MCNDVTRPAAGGRPVEVQWCGCVVEEEKKTGGEWSSARAEQLSNGQP